MNYEQKYKEALERARYYHSKDYMLINSAIENIFPELKESEDERIRKGLIKAFGTIGKKDWGGLIVRDVLAWLEKQDEQIELKKVEQDNHPRIVMADFNGGEGFYKLHLDNLNKEQVDAIEILLTNSN